jgi:hypothetical protein
VGSSPSVDGLGEDPGARPESPLLFADENAELELQREIRLSELWGKCRRGALPMADFLELARLVNDVEGVPGTECQDCARLERPRGRGSWALATTGFCRVHLRLRLGEAEIDRTH